MSAKIFMTKTSQKLRFATTYLKPITIMSAKIFKAQTLGCAKILKKIQNFTKIF